MEKPREIAVRILKRHEEQSDYLENLLEAELAGARLTPADRGLVQELTFGVVRWKATLDWLIANQAPGRTQKTVLQILLRLGLYQIFWLERIPDHAAVHETVAMAKRLGFGAQSGFVNAILRGYLRQQSATETKLKELKVQNPALGYSHPEWLVESWRKRWGDEKAVSLLDWNNLPPPTYARLNTLKASPAQLLGLWELEGVQFFPREWDWTGPDLVFELKSYPPLSSLPSFQQGMFYIQDPSTLLAVRTLDPQPGETVLDLCAAPGGKATFMAQQMQNSGRIMARDISPWRLDLVWQNSARLGADCIEPSLIPTEPQSSVGSGPFDRILVDAPCSNTGVMRRRVDVRWRLRPEEIARLRRSQLSLLESAAAQLKPGGALVYSTCSLEPPENEELIREFLAANADLQLAEERALLPFVEGADGAYVAKLTRLR